MVNYTSYSIILTTLYNIHMPVSIRFWLYLIPNICSIICSIFALFHFLFDRQLRQAMNNHIIIILLFIGLIYELTSVPLMLYYFQFSATWKLSKTFTHLWTFIDYLCYSTQLIGFAWASIERHILIFHFRWLSTKTRCFLLHYFPLIVLFTYCFVYYFILTIFPLCEDLLIPSPFNGVPVSCILFIPILLTYDTVAHQILPTLIIIMLSTALFIRILWQKSRLNRSIRWRKQMKMTIQLLSISVLYLIFMGPRTILQFCLFLGLIQENVFIAFLHSCFFANYIIFLFPIFACGSMLEFRQRINRIFLWHKQRRSIRPDNRPSHQKLPINIRLVP
ncbi:unnamed protein product [Adineta ricciae]|uniref:G-protein coupled receptors family 1 profile domain-containing protein n=1 Tax=Adineta ricciae TaxID=249248 RepID=A0A816E6F5_ADIRI|nr:unnamed protein product [Adineta ricciae]